MEYSTCLDLLKKLKEPFPDEIVKYREGPYDKVAKKQQYFKYIPSEHLQERLDSVLPLGWSWEIIKVDTLKLIKEVKEYTQERDANGKSRYNLVDKEVEQVIVQGRLTLKDYEGALLVTRDALGGCDVTYGSQAGDQFKIASSNAFKKACLELGIGRYIAIEAEALRSAAKPGSRQQNTRQESGTTPSVQTHSTNTGGTVKSSNPFKN